MNDEMLTPNEVAEFLKVPVTAIWRWCREGTLPAVKIGKYWRISQNNLNEFLKANSNSNRYSHDHV